MKGISLLKKTVLPPGFRAAAAAAGLRPDGRDDMALIFSEIPASAAGTFTSHRLPAACVKLCRDNLRRKTSRAIVINSAIANACTGSRGMRDARDTAALAAAELRLAPHQVLVCSTGRIGPALPMDRIRYGIELLSANRGDDPMSAARAIMTTDRVPKAVSRRFPAGGKSLLLTGLAKGAGMIEPRMATMLAFLVTDALIEPRDLQDVLREAVNVSFNRISVDGDMSTNDTVLMLANGASGERLKPGIAGWDMFVAALRQTCLDLARAIVADGEGASKLVTLKISGAMNNGQADRAARALARSLLVKTSWDGNDANWGRILDVLGYCGVKLAGNRLALHYNGIPAVIEGTAADTPADKLNSVVAGSSFTITADLGVGNGSAELLTCECSADYVRINR